MPGSVCPTKAKFQFSVFRLIDLRVDEEGVYISHDFGDHTVKVSTVILDLPGVGGAGLFS